MSSAHLFAIPSGIIWASVRQPPRIKPITELFQSERERKHTLKRKRAHSPSPSDGENVESESELSSSEPDTKVQDGDEKADNDIESQSTPHVPNVPKDIKSTTRVTAQGLLSELDNPPLFPHPSSIPQHLMGFKAGSARPREDIFEQQRKLGLLVAIIYRCAQKGDWERASRAIGLLLRSGPSRLLEELMVGSPDITGLAAECLMRRGPNYEGSKRTRMSHQEPSPITYSGLQAAINLYERLVQWFPYTHRHKRRRVNWYPSLYSLKIYTLLARQQEQLKRAIFKVSSQVGNYQKEDDIRKATLASLVSMEEDLDNVLEAPLNKNRDLLRLRGMMIQWEADLIIPTGKQWKKLWKAVKRYEAEQEGKTWDENTDHNAYSDFDKVVFTDGETISSEDENETSGSVRTSVVTSISGSIPSRARESTISSTSRAGIQTIATGTRTLTASESANRQASIISSVESNTGAGTSTSNRTETSRLSRSASSNRTHTPGRSSVLPSRERSVMSHIASRQSIEHAPTPSIVSALSDDSHDSEYIRAIYRAWNLLVYREKEGWERGRLSDEDLQNAKDVLMTRRELRRKAEGIFQEAEMLEAEQEKNVES